MSATSPTVASPNPDDASAGSSSPTVAERSSSPSWIAVAASVPVNDFVIE